MKTAVILLAVLVVCIIALIDAVPASGARGDASGARGHSDKPGKHGQDVRTLSHFKTNIEMMSYRVDTKKYGDLLENFQKWVIKRFTNNYQILTGLN